jgi:hypothetical protein
MPSKTQRAGVEGGRRGVVVAWKYSGETSEQAWARWRVEHSGEDPDKAGLKVMLISWLDPQINGA